MKRRLVAFILVLSIILPFTHTHTNAEQLLNTSYNSKYNIQVSAKDRSLLIDFPQDEYYERGIVYLCDYSGTRYNEKYFYTYGPFEYGLNSVSDGVYYLQIFIYQEDTGYYLGYIYNNDVKITISGNKVDIAKSDTYEKNVKIFNAGKKDKLTLQYYLKPSYDIPSDNEKIIALAKEITKGIDDDYEKIRAIHDWVCNNIYYDLDSLLYGNDSSSDPSDALDTLKSHKGVCYGYATLTAALLRASGFPTKVVDGYALGLGVEKEWTPEVLSSAYSNHAWNEVYLSGRWIIIDTTWDSSNIYYQGKFSKNTGLRNYKYFDATLEMFSYDHLILSDDTAADRYAEDCFLDNVKVTPAKKTLYLNNTQKKTVNIKVTVPKDFKGIDYNVNYRSSNPKVAKVSENGKVTAVSKGNATITTVIKTKYMTRSYTTTITVKK